MACQTLKQVRRASAKIMLSKKLGLSEKWVSERHFYASQSKLTVGEAAKKMSKTLGVKVLAKDVKEMYKIYYGREAEWHHSGFYGDGNRKMMGRTFFVSEEEVQVLVDNYPSIIQERNTFVCQSQNNVTGFYWVWGNWYDSSNNNKKRASKFLHAYEGPERNAPKNFTPCDMSLMPRIKEAEGRRYDGWNEPKIEDFK